MSKVHDSLRANGDAVRMPVAAANERSGDRPETQLLREAKRRYKLDAQRRNAQENDLTTDEGEARSEVGGNDFGPVEEESVLREQQIVDGINELQSHIADLETQIEAMEQELAVQKEENRKLTEHASARKNELKGEIQRLKR